MTRQKRARVPRNPILKAIAKGTDSHPADPGRFRTRTVPSAKEKLRSRPRKSNRVQQDWA